MLVRKPDRDRADRLVADALGEHPDMQQRRVMLNAVPAVFMLAAAPGSLVAAALMLGGFASVGLVVMGVLCAFPAGMGLPWAIRACVNEIDYRRWRREGSRVGRSPARWAQPGTVDVVLSVLVGLGYCLVALPI